MSCNAYTKSKYKIVPLSEEFAVTIRQNQTDDFGHNIIEQVAAGKGPCRVSLKPFVKGQDIRLLFSHSPFAIDNACNQPGSVFINKEPVKAYNDIHHSGSLPACPECAGRLFYLPNR